MTANSTATGTRCRQRRVRHIKRKMSVFTGRGPEIVSGRGATQMLANARQPNARTMSWGIHILTRRRVLVLMFGNVFLSAPRRIIIHDDLHYRESS